MKIPLAIACTALLAGSTGVAAAQTDARAALAELSSADPATRAKGACDARELGSAASDAVPRLTALLADGSPVDPAVCGERSWRFGDAQDPTTPGEQAASALVSIGSRAFEPLAGALKAPSWIARRNAAWGLGALGDHRAMPLLAVSLRDAEAPVRKHSAWALGVLNDASAVQGLIDALKDVDSGVRRQAAWALGAIGERRAVDPLLKALADQAHEVREQAAWALGALGDERALAPLTKALKDADAHVRRQAAWALGAIGG